MVVSRHRSILVNAVLGEPALEIEHVHAKRLRQLADADEALGERGQRVTPPDRQIVHRHLIAHKDGVTHALPLAGLARRGQPGKLWHPHVEPPAWVRPHGQRDYNPLTRRPRRWPQVQIQAPLATTVTPHSVGR